MNQHITATKQFRKDLDEILQGLKSVTLRPKDLSYAKGLNIRGSRERSLAITKIQEAIMWLGMDLKAIDEESPGSAPNPYPESYNPQSQKIEKTADGIKL